MGMDLNLKAKLQKQRYHIVGEHGGVKVCHWTKESLLRDRQCYKGKFYGVKSHTCVQMSPGLLFCYRCSNAMSPMLLRSTRSKDPDKWQWSNGCNKATEPRTLRRVRGSEGSKTSKRPMDSKNPGRPRGPMCPKVSTQFENA